MNLNWDQDILNDFLFLTKFRDPVPSHHPFSGERESNQDPFLRLSSALFNSSFPSDFSSHFATLHAQQQRRFEEEVRRRAELRRRKEKEEAEELEARIYDAFWKAV